MLSTSLSMGYTTRMDVETVLEEALRLPSEQRAAIAERLWESLLPPNHRDVFDDSSWLAEVERRADSNELGLTWEEAEARIRRRLARS